MRFSSISALCAAPLVALAGSLEGGLLARGALDNTLKVRTETSGEKGKVVEVVKASETVQVTQIILIWINLGGTAATHTINTVSSTSTTAQKAAKTHEVLVGGTAGLVYSPSSIEAAVGDMVVFTFQSQNHTVTQSTFDVPCKKMTGGIDSGFMSNINNTVNPAPQIAIQGMVFSINPGKEGSGKTQADFVALAKAENGTAPAASSTSATNTLATAVIVGGAASATSAAADTTGTSANSMVPGAGTLVGGACSCSCLCGVAAFPIVTAQGLASFGGLSGSMPIAALEV